MAATRWLTGAVLVVVAGGAGTAMAVARTPEPGPAAPQLLPGTCRLAQDPSELLVIPSDSSPAVPCTQHHQTEVMWTTIVTGPVAAVRVRPNGELLNATYGAACYDYAKDRAYLGAGPQDVTWGLAVWAKFPTAAAWARGDRTLVCEASTATDGPYGPTIDYPIAGVMSTVRSARFRLCRGPGGPVTCERPHNAEAVSPNVVLSGPWPGVADATRMAQQACQPVVDAYLGHPIGERPDLAVAPDPVSQATWAQSGPSLDCWISFADGRSETGSVRGGLR